MVGESVSRSGVDLSVDASGCDGACRELVGMRACDSAPDFDTDASIDALDAAQVSQGGARRPTTT